MSGFQEFTNSFGFVVFFLVGTLIFTMVFGEQVAFWFLLLVLLGQIYANVDKFQSLVGRFNQ